MTGKNIFKLSIIIFVLLLLSFLVYFIFGMIRVAKTATAVSNMVTLKYSYAHYLMDNRSSIDFSKIASMDPLEMPLPIKQELINSKRPQGLFADEWHIPYKITLLFKDDSFGVKIVSAGADHKWGTRDDIVEEGWWKIPPLQETETKENIEQ